MSSVISTAGIEIDGSQLEIRAQTTTENQLSLTLRGGSFGSFDNDLRLSQPFRSQINGERLERVVRTLLSHDFLLSKKLKRGGELEFLIEASSNRKTQRLEAVVSLNQESAVSSKPSERILPWILQQADTSDLYPFQRDGVDWLLSSDSRLLADDMGLGKTVQAIFGVRHGFSERLFKTVLILCPKSLVLNWLAEFRKWAPELISLAISPPAKNSTAVWDRSVDNTHVVITNYEQIRELGAALEDRQFDLVVADEAHRLRNATSQVVQGFKFIRRMRFWALTGTPIERDLKDLATLMSLLDEKRFSIADARTAGAALREKAKPYILRRTKLAVLSDLPEVVTRIEPLELLDNQRKTYKTVQSGIGCNGEQLKNPLHKLGELRRVCDYDPVSKTSIKLDRIHEQLLEVQSLGEKAIIFSFVLEPLEVLLAMTQKTLGAIMIHGGLDGDERNQVIKRFKTDPNITALYASSKVASEGLTLVEANHVFFINRWWNPSSNAQARDRVNRIGQKRCVFIHEYVCVGTVEESIQRLLMAKGNIYENVIGKLEETLLKDSSIAAHLDGKKAD
ncbi:DEAD/DEAH box helicase [Stieleria sp. TO1_6]|uniref:DEAD/DEAH box helicase n=1 Tax=Stieleria tagensis TaxID=2956795 RepID=UPI00209B56F3|nr:DEAD/DEAH box helicase [Stieleria tagensis]MCO8123527.1 DEAD/DEAH box helicase [Stieleria tagensis]